MRGVAPDDLIFSLVDSNAAVLYAAPRLLQASVSRAPLLKRLVNGVSQAFAVLHGHEILVGASAVRQISFVMPVNGSPRGWPASDGGI